MEDQERAQGIEEAALQGTRIPHLFESPWPWALDTPHTRTEKGAEEGVGTRRACLGIPETWTRNQAYQTERDVLGEASQNGNIRCPSEM
jgi:hypothetical protein